MSDDVVNAQTRIAAIIGNPVAQSLSPVIHNAVFRSLGVNWLYLAFLVESEKVRQTLTEMAALGIAGYSVTMPHKNEVARIVAEIGEVDEVVRKTSAANTVMLRSDNSVFATNTDGQGACNAIESVANFKIAGSRVVLLGAGGTASAVAYALVKNGAKDVLIHNRSPQRAEELVARIEGCRIGRQAELANDVEQAQIVINTTPVGFDPSGAGSKTESPIDVRLIKSHHIVLDAVYRPLETSLLAAAKKVGAKTVDGLEMLVHQAALQQEIWLGQRGDTKLMRDAALNTQ